MIENLQSADSEQLFSVDLFDYLEEHFGKATSRTVSRRFDFMIAYLQETDPGTSISKEKFITSQFYESDFDENGPSKYITDLASTLVDKHIEHMLNGHRKLIMQIAADGGNTFGSKMDQRLVEFGEHLNDAFKAQREVKEALNKIST